MPLLPWQRVHYSHIDADILDVRARLLSLMMFTILHQRLEALAPSASITVADADGVSIVSGGVAKGEVTFKFVLTVKCNARMKKLLNIDSVTHNCQDVRQYSSGILFYREP